MKLTTAAMELWGWHLNNMQGIWWRGSRKRPRPGLPRPRQQSMPAHEAPVYVAKLVMDTPEAARKLLLEAIKRKAQA